MERYSLTGGVLVSDKKLEEIEMKMVRFRTLGCYPLTGAVESTASTLPEIIQEMLLATSSERQQHFMEVKSIPMS